MLLKSSSSRPNSMPASSNASSNAFPLNKMSSFNASGAQVKFIGRSSDRPKGFVQRGIFNSSLRQNYDLLGIPKTYKSLGILAYGANYVCEL